MAAEQRLSLQVCQFSQVVSDSKRDKKDAATAGLDGCHAVIHARLKPNHATTSRLHHLLKHQHTSIITASTIICHVTLGWLTSCSIASRKKPPLDGSKQFIYAKNCFILVFSQLFHCTFSLKGYTAW